MTNLKQPPDDGRTWLDIIPELKPLGGEFLPSGEFKRYPEERAWVIEMNDCGLKYYSVMGSIVEDPDWESCGGFDPDINLALRFARKADAEAYIEHTGWTKGHVYAAEHVWGGEKVRPETAPEAAE